MNDLAIVKVCRNSREIINLPDESYNKIAEIAKVADGHKILRVTEILTKAEVDMRYSTSGRITLETAILKAAMPETDYDIDALIGKINMLEKKLQSGEYSLPAATPKPALHQAYSAPNDEINPFDLGKTQANDTDIKTHNGGVTPPDRVSNPPFAEQEVLWEQAPMPKPAQISSADRDTVFGKFIRALRTTRKNAVVFTLCMDLNHLFEGEKLVLTTDSEAVYKGLNRAENAKFISDVLAELGVNEHEVRLVGKEDSDYDKALNQLKKNFDGTDIEIK